MSENPTKTTYFVYMLECSNGAYYTGYTTNIERRYAEHVEGTDKCKFTRSFPPVRLAACWEVSGNVSDALKLEKKIKSLNKNQKEHLIADPSGLPDIFTQGAEPIIP